MTLDEIRTYKKALKLTNQDLAELTGIPVSTLAKILSGVTRKPHTDTMKVIEDALSSMAGQVTYGRPASVKLSAVAEPSYTYGSSAEKLPEEPLAEAPWGHSLSGQSARLYTLQDYLALPPDKRVELIDGRFYDMASPTGVHQQIALLLWKQFYDCIHQHDMPCIAQIAPFDVLLDSDIYTVVQPDVMIFCKDPKQALKTRAFGAPDFVCEVLSPSTAFRDRHLKLYKYRHAGVREVWIVDPDGKTISVYRFMDGTGEPDLYTFKDQIPVRISEGKCVIDFSSIDTEISQWL